MATVTGLTAGRMQEIIDSSVESASISGSTLIFTRHDGSSFAAGDFAAFISGQITSAVAAAVPPAVVGGVTALGNFSGAYGFIGLTPATMVNRIITMTLVNNLIVGNTNIPSPAIPGTQFAMVIKQDGTGGRTISLVGIKRSQGVLTLSTAANAIDIVTFMYDGTNWYAGPMGLNFT